MILSNISQVKLSLFCKEHGIARLSLFGSMLRGEAGPESDVDLLVEFEPGTRVSLIGMVRIEAVLSEMIGRKVDLRTAGDLSRYFRQEVVNSAEILYAA